MRARQGYFVAIVVLAAASCASPAKPPTGRPRDVGVGEPSDVADAAAADAAEVDDLPPGPPAGLRLIGYGDVTALAHAREIVADGDYVYLADSNGLPVLRSVEGGRLDVLHGLTRERSHHCSTASLHAASHRLICGAGDSGFLDFIDVTTPASPVTHPWSLNERLGPGETPIYEVADVEVSGNTLWVAAHQNGLLRVPLGADGQPGELVRTGVGTGVTAVVAGGGRLAVLDRTLGLVILSEGDLSTLGAAPLDGPALDVTMRGDRVAVALGSEGARVFRVVDGVPTRVETVQPRCVATGVALSDDQLAVACLTGVTLYDLSSPGAPRVAGFAPSKFGMLDVAFGPRGLLVSDWYGVQHFATDPAANVEVPDVPHAVRLQPGADAHIPVRNPADVPLSVGWQLRRTGVTMQRGTLDLPASGEATVTIPAAQLEAAGSREGLADLFFFRHDGAPSSNAVTALSRVAHRAPSDLPARGIVAVGDRFPALRRTLAADSPETLPPSGAPALVVFVTFDCFLQWPQLEDMAWSLAHGTGQPRATVLGLTQRFEDAWESRRLTSVHAAENLATAQWAAYSRSVPGQEDEANPVAAFEHSFIMQLPGADFPHDYLIDASGVVVGTLREFRGRWNLQR